MKYMGYTNRTFTEQFKEHNTARNNNPESMLAKHLISNRITQHDLMPIVK